MDLNSAEQRFHNDPIFHSMVTLMEKMILDLEMTPSEIREAAMYACLRVERRQCRPLFVTPAADAGEGRVG